MATSSSWSSSSSSTSITSLVPQRKQKDSVLYVVQIHPSTASNRKKALFGITVGHLCNNGRVLAFAPSQSIKEVI